MPAPIKAIRSPIRGAASQGPSSAVSRLAASTARPGRHPVPRGVRQGMERADREPVARLVGMEAEGRPPQKVLGALLHHADAAIAALDRTGKVATLEGRAHGLVLAFGYLAAKHQGLALAADAAEERPHQGRIGQDLRANLAAAGRRYPEGFGLRRRRPLWFRRAFGPFLSAIGHGGKRNKRWGRIERGSDTGTGLQDRSAGGRTPVPCPVTP